jgi:hypothetical protein
VKEFSMQPFMGEPASLAMSWDTTQSLEQDHMHVYCTGLEMMEISTEDS